MPWYKTSWMLLFRCRFTFNELAALNNHLPPEEYCVVEGNEEREYYGVMVESLHEKLLDILSGETLETLEYVDEREFRDCLDAEAPEIFGNRFLLRDYL